MIFLAYIGLGMVIIPNIVRYQKLFGLILFCSLFFTNSVFKKDQLTLLAFTHNQDVDLVGSIHGVEIALIYNNIAYLIGNFSNSHNQQLITDLQQYGVGEFVNLNNKYSDFQIGVYRISITNSPNNIVKINKLEDPGYEIVIAENIFPISNQQHKIKQLIYINSSNNCKLPEEDLRARYNKVYFFNTAAYRSCFDRQFDNFNLLEVDLVDGMKKRAVVLPL